MVLLSVQLKEDTKHLHTQGLRSKFMRQFFKGEISPTTYGRFLISLYHIYSNLERALDHYKDHQQLSLLYFPKELSRTALLERDLEFYNGPDWREMLTPTSPAQQAYINAIQRCATSPTPELLAAHAYIRYLGDLSGGQILAKRLQKFNDIPEGQGVSFYQFDAIEDTDAFKDVFRKRLNMMEISDELQQQIVDEVKETYHKTFAIFSEFDDDVNGPTMTEQEQAEQMTAMRKDMAKAVAEEHARKQALKSPGQNMPDSWPNWQLTTLWHSLTRTVGLS
ncbi:MAG: heme oxygenase-domain-containing protein [Benniella sp.]|nr:MAG: heme oxygenase-domain-containing protein [Benniella sp.]